MPGYGGTIRLTHLIGKHRALELILTGKHITAQEALALGLLNRVVPHNQLDNEVTKLAMEIAEKPLPALMNIIKSVNLTQPPQDTYAFETEFFVSSFKTEEAKEGINAFLQKRKPSWKKT